MDTNGFITTVAGNVTPGFSGDGGSAISASLNSAAGLATDAPGNLFVAEVSNSRVRKIVFQGPNLVFTNSTASDAGAYDVIVKNDFGSVTSSVATLTFSPPAIVTQPVNQTTIQGATASFSVTANGFAPMTYQWQKNGVNLASGANVSGATSTVLTISNLTTADPAIYSVLVTDAYGTTGSAGAVLTVNTISLNSFWAVYTNTNGDNLTTLTQGANGNFYGTSSFGIFRLTTNGIFTNLFTFNVTNGADPAGALTQGPDGNFYGTTEEGGTNGGFGTIFSISPGGAFTSLWSFNSNNGATPATALTLAIDGSFYGTTRSIQIGNQIYGDSVFKITTNGIFTPVINFSNLNYQSTGIGRMPFANLVQASDGTLYGTTGSGIFRTTTNGVANAVISGTNELLVSDEFYNPTVLVLGKDGNLYGSTLGVPSQNSIADGSIYTCGTNGAFADLIQFVSETPSNPNSLIQGKDGNLYGTTLDVDTFGSGTVFQMSTNGVFTVLVKFSGLNGYRPSSLIQAADGNLYGIDLQNCTNNVSAVFRVTVTPAVPHFPLITVTGNAFTVRWQMASGQLYQAQSSTNLSTTNWINIGSPAAAINGLAIISDTISSGATQRFYRVVPMP